MNVKPIVNQPVNDKDQDKILQDLKIEYYKYKSNLNSIIETHKNLKNRIDKEINRKNCNISKTQSKAFDCNLY